MELEKINQPKKYLRKLGDKYQVMCFNTTEPLTKEQSMYSVFFISSDHFKNNGSYLSSDMSWGYCDNILFKVMGYCSKVRAYYHLVCSVESIL